MNNAEYASRATRKSHRSMMAAIVCYATTIALGIGGAVLAAYGRNTLALTLGGISFLTAILCIAAFRASRKWRVLADHIGRRS